MKNLVDEIVELTIDADTRPAETGVPGLLMIKGDVPQHQLAALYQPIIGLVVQGRKILTVGGRKIDVIGPSYYLVPMHLPVKARVSGRDGRDYLSLGLALNNQAVHRLLRDLPADLVPTGSRDLAACEADEEFLYPWLRMLRLMKSPHDIAALAPVYEREILYRVLVGSQGWYLRQLALTESAFSKIASTVQWLRAKLHAPDRDRRSCALRGDGGHDFPPTVQERDWSKSNSVSEAVEITGGEKPDRVRRACGRERSVRSGLPESFSIQSRVLSILRCASGTRYGDLKTA
jgi:hypothetical protein